MKLTNLVTLGIALAVTTCSNPAQQEFTRNDAESVRKLISDFVAAYNAKDAPKTVAAYAPVAVLMPPNSATLRGQESIKGYFDVRFAEFTTDLTIEPKDIGGQRTLAYIVGDYRLTRRPTGGGDEVRDRGRVMWIARNLGGQWRFDYQMWASNLPVPMATPENPRN